MRSHVPRIRVALLLESLGSGGAERQAVGLAQYLRGAGFEARVAYYAGEEFFAPALAKLGIPVARLPRSSRWDPRPCFELARWLRRGEVDVVHGFLVMANLYAVLAARLARRGVAIVSERSDPGWRTGYRRLIERWAVNHADAVTVNSQRACESIRQLAPERRRVEFIPNALSFDTFSPVAPEERARLRERLGWTPQQRVVLTVASFHPVKNHDGILDAVELLPADATNLTFQWVGALLPEDRSDAIQYRLAQNGCGELVRVHGPRQDVLDLYRACDVVLLNSWFEGTPNAVLEALACGRPVVATSVADVVRYVVPGETGWIVAPGDSAGLRDALVAVSRAGDEDLEQLGARGRALLMRLGLDWGSVGVQYAELYASLVRKAHGA